MGTPRIVAVSTATPRHRFDQATLLRMAGYEDSRRAGFFANSEIDGRHLYLDPETFDPLESAVAHAIFADGAGAMAIAGEGDGPVIVGHQSLFRSEHLGAMGFEFPGGRPRVVLSKDVRRIGAAMMKEMADLLMDSQGLKKEDVRHFVLHSAGRRVIEQARRLLDLDEPQIAHSRHVLRHLGNMSSATVVFVLEETLRSGQPVPGDWGLMIALGPGFAAEGALLRW